MNVSNIADLADILAAAGVIASLLFVAFQIRQNTRTVRNQYLESTLDRLADLFSRPLDERVATTLDKGTKNFNDLTGPEKLVFGAWANEYIMGASRLTALARQGLLEPPIAAMAERRLNWFFKSPGMYEWWRDADRHPIPAPFEAFVDKVSSEARPDAA